MGAQREGAGAQRSPCEGQEDGQSEDRKRLAWREERGHSSRRQSGNARGEGRLTLSREGLLWSQAPCFCARRKWGPWERIGGGAGLSDSD